MWRLTDVPSDEASYASIAQDSFNSSEKRHRPHSHMSAIANASIKLGVMFG